MKKHSHLFSFHNFIFHMKRYSIMEIGYQVVFSVVVTWIYPLDTRCNCSVSSISLNILYFSDSSHFLLHIHSTPFIDKMVMSSCSSARQENGVWFQSISPSFKKTIFCGTWDISSFYGYFNVNIERNCHYDCDNV